MVLLDSFSFKCWPYVSFSKIRQIKIVHERKQAEEEETTNEGVKSEYLNDNTISTLNGTLKESYPICRNCLTYLRFGCYQKVHTPLVSHYIIDLY